MASAALIPTAIAFSLVILFWIGCSVFTIYKLYCTDGGTKINGLIKSMLILYLISYSLCSIIAFTLMMLALSDIEIFYFPNIGWNIMMVSVFITGSIGLMSFYILLILKTMNFKGSVYQVSHKTVTVYIILSIFNAILFIFWFVSYYLFDSILQQYPIMVTIVIIFAYLLDVFIALSILYIVSSRLVTLATKVDTDRELQNRTKRINQSLSERQQRLIHVVTKQCLLGFVAISMFNIAIPIDIAFYVYVYQHTKWTYLLTLYLAFICLSIEMICILFVFSFSSKYYDYFCTRCHNGCNWCCTRYTQFRLSVSGSNAVKNTTTTVKSASTEDCSTNNDSASSKNTNFDEIQDWAK